MRIAGGASTGTYLQRDTPEKSRQLSVGRLRYIRLFVAEVSCHGKRRGRASDEPPACAIYREEDRGAQIDGTVEPTRS